MAVNLITDFFRAIPQVFVELWNFGNGIQGVLVTGGSIVLVAAFCLAAQRTRDNYGWVSATFGGCAAMVAGLWAFGILPSAWIYFMDGSVGVLADTVIPSRVVVGEFVVFNNFYEVFRDSIVMAETAVAMVAFTALALWIQKKYPRTLAAGEEAGEKSGGYK
ncbi:hypothetical protein BH23ACT9_BH23ACT9_21550 [soil metagenome]